jgi:lysophospholipase L1-like esterase
VFAGAQYPGISVKITFRKISLVLAVAAMGMLAVAVGAHYNAAPPSKFYLHPNDTVVFYGDSITEQRLYTMLTELYVVTRYPNLNVRFVDSGWGGDRVSGGSGGAIDLRLSRDVLAYHPTVMTIMLGMNDGGYTNHTPANDEAFFTGYQHIVESVRHTIPDLRITVIDPSPFDDVTRPITLQPNGYNAVLTKYGDWLQQYAGQAKLDFADLNTGVVAALRTANSTDSAVAQKIIPDRVHPGLAGHLLMAEQLLKAWHARSAVSTVALTVADGAGKVTESEYAHITNLHGAGPVGWTETDEALPLPFSALLGGDHDQTVGLAMSSSDVTEALNQQILRVAGLPPGRYKLTIDDKAVVPAGTPATSAGAAATTWSEGELAKGINLAILDTPMSRQAAEVRDLTVKHIEVHFHRFHTFEAQYQGLDLQHLDETIKSLDTLDNEIVAHQRATAQPRPHVFQLALAQ